MCCFSTVLMCLSVLLCLQRAGPASTNLGWGTWSVQSVPLTASLIMRVRCTAAVRKTTSVPRETPPPWLAPVSIRANDAPCLCVLSRNSQMIQVPPWPGLTPHISDRRNPAQRAESCGRIFYSLSQKTCTETLSYPFCSEYLQMFSFSSSITLCSRKSHNAKHCWR